MPIAAVSIYVPVPFSHQLSDDWLTDEVLSHIRLELLSRLRRKLGGKLQSVDSTVGVSVQGNRFVQFTFRPDLPDLSLARHDASAILHDQLMWLERSWTP